MDDINVIVSMETRKKCIISFFNILISRWQNQYKKFRIKSYYSSSSDYGPGWGSHFLFEQNGTYFFGLLKRWRPIVSFIGGADNLGYDDPSSPLEMRIHDCDRLNELKEMVNGLQDKIKKPIVIVI